MPDSPNQPVWVVVRVRRGSTSPEDASLHTGFTDPLPANLLCDILNDKSQNAPFEFRVLEMPRFRVVTHPDRTAS